MYKALFGAAMAAFLSTPAAAEFKFSFDWSGLKLCTTGSPNTVANPRFKVSGLPAGTTAV
ncbi:hypothetical protein [Falsiruegeria mediterranea]|uniref:Uncharacterized protein n=1 Tax=Falsiruegeria mediterranea M17 TaxID=1200281 RepID=A0A2R8CBM9_9RHOB|nr:hypothetical protein [Falsiruegeria mediterranea]SPJ29788.1 hypothetical protein TRM7615_03310 [Falsiruegeria mediterranea M17]